MAFRSRVSRHTTGLLSALLWALIASSSNELNASSSSLPSSPSLPSSLVGRRLSEFDEVKPFAPPPPPSEATAFTHATFFNVGPCTTVLSVQFEFLDVMAPQSGIFTICPEEYQVIEEGVQLCRVPGPYGIGVSVVFKGIVTELLVTLVDPTDEEGDSNVTSATMVCPNPRPDPNPSPRPKPRTCSRSNPGLPGRTPLPRHQSRPHTHPCLDTSSGLTRTRSTWASKTATSSRAR